MKTVTLADIAREIGMDPKVARAKMRRAPMASGTEVARHTYPSSKKASVKRALQTDRRRK